MPASRQRVPSRRRPRVLEVERRGPWRARLALPNGRVLLLRPIEPDDAATLRASFAALSPEEVRLRFQAPLREMSADMAAELTAIDRKRHFALVVVEDEPDDQALIGAVVRAGLDADHNAEFAIIVGRPLAHQGLGVFLLKKLIRWCRAKRAKRLFGDVLVDNAPMLALTDQLGFEREHIHGDHGLVRVSLPLARVDRG